MMWMILQAEQAEDLVIATGTTTSIREFVRMAFDYVGIKLEFHGQGLNEVARVAECQNPKYQLDIGQEIQKLILDTLGQ